MFHVFRATIVCYCLVVVCYGKNYQNHITDKQWTTSNRQVDEKLAIEMTLPIAFSTFMSGITKWTINQTIVFDHVILNDGNGYDHATGVFRAPIDGVYRFEYSFVIPQKTFFGCLLLVDEAVISSALIDAYNVNYISLGGNSAIARVSKGQSVRLRKNFGDGLTWSGLNLGYSSFSGSLLYVS